MSIHKIKKGPYYYADYYDFNGVRRRISLQTENKQVALLKYQELIRRRNAVKERFPVNITWQAFKDKLLHCVSVKSRLIFLFAVLLPIFFFYARHH